MKLYGTTTSPYVRKIRILATAGGIPFDFVDIRTDEGNAAFARVAPVGKVPVVELDDGRVLPDSGLIASWLWAGHAKAIEAAGIVLAPDAYGDRAAQVVVEGALDAAINWMYLVRRDGVSDRGYLTKQRDRVATCLQWLERNVPFARPLGHATLSLGCALDWLVFRKMAEMAEWSGLVAFRAAWHDSEIGRGTEPG